MVLYGGAATKDPEGKHRVFLARPFSIKTAPRSVNLRISLLHGLTSRREKEREREKRREEIGKATDR